MSKKINFDVNVKCKITKKDKMYKKNGKNYYFMVYFSHPSCQKCSFLRDFFTDTVFKHAQIKPKSECKNQINKKTHVTTVKNVIYFFVFFT